MDSFEPHNHDQASKVNEKQIGQIIIESDPTSRYVMELGNAEK